MGEQSRIRVVIADDHEVVRGGLRALIASAPDMELVAEAPNGRDAVQLITALEPDVVVLDVSMPELNGIEVVRILHAKHPRVRFVMLSMHASGEFVTAAMAAGAHAYLLKEAAGAEVLGAVREVHAGGRYLSAQIRDQYERDKAGAVRSPLEKLSARERQVLQLVAEGKSSSEIAAIVHLSPKTVDTYRSRLMKKLGLASVAELVKFAVQQGITPLT